MFWLPSTPCKFQFYFCKKIPLKTNECPLKINCGHADVFPILKYIQNPFLGDMHRPSFSVGFCWRLRMSSAATQRSSSSHIWAQGHGNLLRLATKIPHNPLFLSCEHASERETNKKDIYGDWICRHVFCLAWFFLCVSVCLSEKEVTHDVWKRSFFVEMMLVIRTFVVEWHEQTASYRKYICICIRMHIGVS